MPHRIQRPPWVSICMYVCFMCGSVAFLVFPSPSVEGTGAVLILIWHLFLLLGGAISAAGAYTRHPLVEAAGFPLLISALTAYSVLLIEDAVSTSLEGRLSLGIVILGACFGLAGRCLELIRLALILFDLDRREDDRG